MLPFSRVIYDQLLYFEWGLSLYYGARQRDRNKRQRRKEQEIETRDATTEGEFDEGPETGTELNGRRGTDKPTAVEEGTTVQMRRERERTTDRETRRETNLREGKAAETKRKNNRK